MQKDNRIKACSNDKCECNTADKAVYYKPSDLFCTKCGSKLVFVCKKCHKRIADEGPKHVICDNCQAKKDDWKDGVLDVGGKVVAGLGASAAVVAGIVAKAAESEVGRQMGTMAKEAIAKGFDALKKNI